ncbi:MAG: hypothetical protein H6727_06545 [Myxococcales bacterium]|nr:hypothetical protein [Myxococcales bacterium]
MSYYVKNIKQAPTNHRIVLERSSVAMTLMGLFFLITGFPLSLVGIMALMPSKEPVAENVFFLGGIGIAFVGASILMLFAWKIPKRFIFDNEQGFLIVEEDDKKSKIHATIPYQDIRDFRTTSRQTGTEGGMSYQTEISKKDGSYWALYSSGSQEKADSLTQYLQKYVDLEKQVPPAELPRYKKIDIDEQDGRTKLSWKINPPFAQTLALSLVMGGFAMTVYELLKTPSMITLAATGFIGLIIVLFAVGRLIALGAKHVIEMDDTQLKFSRVGGIFPRQLLALPLREIAAIHFKFEPNTQGDALFLMNEAQYQGFATLDQAMAEDDEEPSPAQNISHALDLFKAMYQTPRIQTDGLSFGERTYLEQLLQEKIEQRTGHRPH